MAKKKNAEAEPRTRKRTRVRTLFKWIRRISLVAAIFGGVRKVMTDQNETNRPPAV